MIEKVPGRLGLRFQTVLLPTSYVVLLQFLGLHGRIHSNMSSDDATAQALKAKEAGNAAYKSRDFDTAIAKYQEAWDLHKDITYLNNLAGG